MDPRGLGGGPSPPGRSHRTVREVSSSMSKGFSAAMGSYPSAAFASVGGTSAAQQGPSAAAVRNPLRQPRDSGRSAEAPPISIPVALAATRAAAMEEETGMWGKKRPLDRRRVAIISRSKPCNQPIFSYFLEWRGDGEWGWSSGRILTRVLYMHACISLYNNI